MTMEELHSQATPKSGWEKFWDGLKSLIANLATLMGAGAALAAGAYLMSWALGMGLPVTMV